MRKHEFGLTRGPSRVETRIIQSAEAIRQTPPESISYQHTILCQTGLPYRSTSERTWDARNGRVFLHVKAGELLDPHGNWVPQPLPWGAKARLVYIHLNSEAIKQRSRHIEVEHSMTAFLEAILHGRNPNGREIADLKTQLAAIAVAHMRMGVVGPDAHSIRSLPATALTT